VNILYVENHSVFAENVKRQFLSQHRVKVVPSLSSADQAVQKEPFDLLLVDYDLDDGKGDEFVRALRAADNPVIIIGVSSHKEGNAALIKAGATAVCSKMDFDRIQKVIDEVT
jgi:DNA-binding NarL/FixJ family response regulator